MNFIFNFFAKLFADLDSLVGPLVVVDRQDGPPAVADDPPAGVDGGDGEDAKTPAAMKTAESKDMKTLALQTKKKHKK